MSFIGSDSPRVGMERSADKVRWQGAVEELIELLNEECRPQYCSFTIKRGVSSTVLLVLTLSTFTYH